MLEKIIGTISPLRSHLFGLIGVIAVASLGTNILGYIFYQKQNDVLAFRQDKINDLVEANDGLIEANAVLIRVAELEQNSTKLLQDKVDLLAQRSADQSRQLKELEKGNAQVREYMARPLPDDLRRLLNGK